MTTLIIQVATGSIAPILTLYIRDLAGNVSNIAFISGLIASVPGWQRCLARRGWENWGPRRSGKILICALVISVLLLIPMSMVHSPWQLGLLRFCLVPQTGPCCPPYRPCWFTTPRTRLPGGSSAITSHFATSVTSPDRFSGRASPPASVSRRLYRDGGRGTV